MSVWLLCATLAWSAPLPESHVDTVPSPTWNAAVHEGMLSVTEADLRVGTTILGHPPVGPVAISADKRRLVWAERAPGQLTTRLMRAEWSGTWTVRVLFDGAATRPALHPDGHTVAFVWNADRVAGLWSIPFEGGTPTPLTNHELVWHKGGGAPDGFTPLPVRDPAWFDGNTLRWVSEHGEHAVEVDR